jgi:UDP-N-acetylglucosamine 2-epimerase (non-hydrolysing)
MIVCFIGTRAQLIKMAPIILRLEQRGIPLRLVLTGQHRETMVQLLKDFGIRSEPRRLYDGAEITGLIQMGLWFLRSLWRCLWDHGEFLPRDFNGTDIILVHGDTMSTLLGALAGKLKGFKVAHIEAGLRSHNLFHPFPEEITRLAVSRLADLAYCPGEWAYRNLDGTAAKRIDTLRNTLADALEHARQSCSGPPPAFGGRTFGIASIHRFESISSKTRLTAIVGMIEEAALTCPIVFVLHPSTRKKMNRFDLMSRLEGNANIAVTERMGYVDFVKLMQMARFVITDGGGNQEELSYLGIPTLLMRRATERQEGLGTTAVLGNFDRNILRRFLDELPDHKHKHDEASVSASNIVVEHLLQCC